MDLSVFKKLLLAAVLESEGENWSWRSHRSDSLGALKSKRRNHVWSDLSTWTQSGFVTSLLGRTHSSEALFSTRSHQEKVSMSLMGEE